MSFIHDALIKSQQQRREGEVPGLDTPAQLTAAPARGIQVGFAGGVTVVLAIAALLFGAHTLFGAGGAARPPADRPSAAQRANEVHQGAATVRDAAPRAADCHSGPAGPVAESPPQIGRAALPVAVAPFAPAPDAGALATPRVNRRERVPDRRARQAAGPPSPVRPARAGRNPMAEIRDASTRRAAPAEASRASVARGGDEPAPIAVEARDPLARLDAPVVFPETLQLAKELRALARRDKAPGPRPVVPKELAMARALAPSAPVPTRAARQSGPPTTLRPEPPRDAPLQVHELPQEMLQGIGELAINAHVYAAAPPERMIIINMKRYREGERLREGPRVDEITASGAVLSYQSRRFHLRVR